MGAAQPLDQALQLLHRSRNQVLDPLHFFRAKDGEQGRVAAFGGQRQQCDQLAAQAVAQPHMVATEQIKGIPRVQQRQIPNLQRAQPLIQLQRQSPVIRQQRSEAERVQSPRMSSVMIQSVPCSAVA